MGSRLQFRADRQIELSRLPPFLNLDIETPLDGLRSLSKEGIRLLGKRHFAPRDWPALPAAERAQMRKIPTADRMGYNQAIEITTVIPDRETTSIFQDWMVDLRGFEPLTS